MPKVKVRIHPQMHGIIINAEDVQEKGEEAKMVANNHQRQYPLQQCPQFVPGIYIDVHLGTGIADKAEDKME